MFTHRVKRTFPSRQSLKTGQLVDATNWRNRLLLEKQGYIVPLEAAPGEAPNEIPDETNVPETIEDSIDNSIENSIEVQVPVQIEESQSVTPELPESEFVEELINIVAPAEVVMPAGVNMPGAEKLAKTAKTKPAKTATRKASAKGKK